MFGFCTITEYYTTKLQTWPEERGICFSSVFLANQFFSLAKIFSFLSTLSIIVVMWSFHERFSDTVLLHERGNSMLEVPFEGN